MGPISLTQSNPAHQLTDPTQPVTKENLDPRPNPQPDTTKVRFQAQLRELLAQITSIILKLM